MTQKKFIGLLHTKINSVDLTKVKADIGRFIPDPKALDIWTPQYFHDLVSYLKFKS